VAVQQILHGGRYGGVHHDYCLQPSAVPQTLPHFRPPRAMTKEQIRECIDDHVEAAKRAIKVGYDGVEVTAFMGYLLANFLSPFVNHRTDEYGGTFENRGRFMVELIESMKDAIGDAHFWIRLNAAELMDDQGGNNEDTCLEYMKLAQASGADGISIVVGWHESRKGALGRDVPSDKWLPLAARAKAALDVPIAFGPRFGDPLMAEQALSDGKFDFWEVCRPFLADPELLIKVREDRPREVKPCVGGLTCLSRMFRNLPYVCTMNPRLGHEVEPEYDIGTTKTPKRVMVVGGGPAGLEAAVVAARKGHEVSVYERTARLGGQLQAASMEIDGGHVFQRVVEHYETQIERYGVTLHLETEVTPKLVSKVAPDVAVVATGARIPASALPGADGAKVIYADRFCESDLVRGQRVICIGGERAGLVVAERLAEAGNEVALTDEGGRIAGDVIPTFKWRHASWLKELRIEVLKGTRAVAVTDEGLRLVDAEGNETVRPCDLLVVGGPRLPDNALTSTLAFRCDELYTVGDAIVPRNLCEAIHEGYKLGVRI